MNSSENVLKRHCGESHLALLLCHLPPESNRQAWNTTRNSQTCVHTPLCTQQTFLWSPGLMFTSRSCGRLAPPGGKKYQTLCVQLDFKALVERILSLL